eukprot:7607280-Heterocapsa_arctica.AAC.1
MISRYTSSTKFSASITCMRLLVQYSRTNRHAEVEDLVDRILDVAPPELPCYTSRHLHIDRQDAVIGRPVITSITSSCTAAHSIKMSSSIFIANHLVDDQLVVLR